MMINLIWQDALITAWQFGFCFTILPMLRARAGRPPLLTSIPTGIGLLMIAFAFATLGLFLAAISAGVSAILWFNVAMFTIMDAKDDWRSE